MRKIATILASSLVLALAACGGGDEVAEEQTENTVEIPADEAMTGVEEPSADVVGDTALDDLEPVDEEAGAAGGQDQDVEAIADDAAAAAEDAIRAAEAGIEE